MRAADDDDLGRPRAGPSCAAPEPGSHGHVAPQAPLVDHLGRPIDFSKLKEEISAPDASARVRSIISATRPRA
jgi:hypothetical protein